MMCRDCAKLEKLVEGIGLGSKFPHLRVFCCNECMLKEIRQHYTIRGVK